MSDLSWLNPTPHAIAVYASRPLSPLTTQHSLPSGRYSLLGPDFHRLDRTSFAWRTHSITSSARVRSVGGSVRPIALAVVRLMTNSSLVGNSIGRSAGFAFQNLVNEVCTTTETLTQIGTIADQTAVFDMLAPSVDREKARRQCVGGNLPANREKHCICQNNDDAGAFASDRLHGRTGLISGLNTERHHCHSQPCSGRLDILPLP